MATIERDGIRLDLPVGWEGRIYQRTPPEVDDRWTEFPRGELTPMTANVLHAANFALPPDAGDYGGGAVEQMTNRDVLTVLLEFDRANAGAPLFSASGLPTIGPGDFDPMALQRVMEGQAGVQRFFSVAQRAFCLYVVLGSYTRRFRTVPMINSVLQGLSIR
jgi:hypothetical protein